MRSIIRHIVKPVLLALLATTIAACNKDNLDIEKGFQVLVSGYNGSGNTLQVTIDTTKYGHSNYMIKPASLIGFNAVYTYKSPKEKLLTITDTVTKKVLFSKPLPATGTKANFNFIYIDDRIVEVKPQAIDPATNKLGFYVQYTVNNEPFDVFIYRKDNTTGKEYRQYLARGVKPKTWVYVDYMVTADFADINLLNNSNIFFTKTGTTDQWAFNDSEAMSKTPASGLNLPVGTEKGLVLPYFLIPGSMKLEYSRLFFVPDRF